jgi:hypothetical protein
VAIHCERGNEEKGHTMSNPNASIAYSGLPRRSLSLPPRNDTGRGPGKLKGQNIISLAETGGYFNFLTCFDFDFSGLIGVVIVSV